MEYSAGIDISLRSCALCIVDGKGTVLLERELPCEVSDIAECLGAFPNPVKRVGFEAGAMSQHLFHGLKAEGFDVVCTFGASRKFRMLAVNDDCCRENLCPLSADCLAIACRATDGRHQHHFEGVTELSSPAWRS